jgi:hypothetical protein
MALNRKGFPYVHRYMTDVMAPSPARDLTIPLLGVACVVAAGLFPFKISKMLGLPAHVLFLHVPVVLVPIVCILIAALAIRPAWRAKWGVATGLLAVGTMAATILTVGAGNALADERGGTRAGKLAEHAELGEQLRLLIIVLTIAFILLLVADQHMTLIPMAAPIIAVAFTALAILTIVWVARTGHLGAELAWGNS